MPDLVIDFVNYTMNVSVTPDKRIPPQMTEILNADLAQQGAFRKRYGIDNLSTNASPNIAATKVNAITPSFKIANATANALSIAVADDKIFALVLSAGTWTQVGSAITNGNNFPYNIAWGINNAGDSVVYLAHINAGIFAVDALGTSYTKYGSSSDASNPFSEAGSVEFWKDKLFVANTVESSVSQRNRIRWSVTGNDNDFHSSGSGFLDLRFPGSGSGNNSLSTTALRVYRDVLWIGTDVSLHRITGTSSLTFGSSFVRPQNSVNGATFYETGGFLWYIDRDGIWKFNGVNAVNVIQDNSITVGMRERWETLSDQNDIDVATASWNDEYGIYSVFFPNAQEQWDYYYKTGQWAITKPNTVDAVNVISPSLPRRGETPTINLMGAKTNGRVYKNSTGSRDDGQAITSSFTTGYLSLSSLARQPHGQVSISDIWAEIAEQTAAITYTLDMEIDGNAQLQQSIVTSIGSGDTFPTLYHFPLPAQTSGRYHQFKFQEATDNARGDMRRVIIRYEVERL